MTEDTRVKNLSTKYSVFSSREGPVSRIGKVITILNSSANSMNQELAEEFQMESTRVHQIFASKYHTFYKYSTCLYAFWSNDVLKMYKLPEKSAYPNR